MDDPEHKRHRLLFQPAFTPKAIASLKSRIERIVHERLDALLSMTPPVDLVECYCLPIPSLVICALLGAPYEDHMFFQDAALTLLSTDATAEAAAEANDRLTDYFSALVQRRLQEPSDDLLSQLADRHVRTGELPAAQLANDAKLIVIAGFETTARQIALGVFALLQHPEQLGALVASDDEIVVENAVQELLRYVNVAQFGKLRLATENVALGGTTIRAGDAVVVLADAANFDEEVFAHACRLDIKRQGADRHLAFGTGVHRCLGEPLAEAELEIAYTALFRRLPGLRFAVPPEEIEFMYQAIAFGPMALPVAW